MKRALITGISGQVGSYLAEHLLNLGYDVYGLVRRTSSENLWRLETIKDKIHLLYGDLLDSTSLRSAMQESKPDEVYNLASQSFVGTAWDQPILTGEVTGLGAVRLIDAARAYGPGVKIYQASSSEMFGNGHGEFRPRSPYGCAKLYAHQSAINYRESYGLFVSCGIMFNHESPRRGKEFVTRKISTQVANVKCGEAEKIILGNVDAVRDFGFAGDYVKVMHALLQLDKPRDLVVGTGVGTSVLQLLEYACQHVGLDWRDHLEIDKTLYRPAEIDRLVADTKECDELFPWFKEKRLGVKDIAEMMVDEEMARLTAASI